MNKILLINRIDTNRLHEDKKRIFFLIGDLKKENSKDYLMDVLDKIEFLTNTEMVYKYNGVELYMKEENIPMLIKELIKAGIDIYSVYELYDPMD